MESARDRSRATVFKTLLEPNARWNQERRDIADNDLRRIVDETSTINPDLRKELLYSWQHGFIENKPQDDSIQDSPTLLRKGENRKSGKALMNPLKGKVQSESPHTIKTTAGAVYRKSDIAKAKIAINEPKDKQPKKANTNRSPYGDEPKTKTKKNETIIQSEDSESEELSEEQKGSDRKKVGTTCQDSNYYVTSRDIEVNGGLNLSGKRAKPNNAGPRLQNVKMDKGEKLKAKKQTIQEPKKKRGKQLQKQQVHVRLVRTL